MAGEVGEVANLIKKHWRGDQIKQYEAKLRDELADVRIYLQHIADAIGCDLDKECARKLAVVEKRLQRQGK